MWEWMGRVPYDELPGVYSLPLPYMWPGDRHQQTPMTPGVKIHACMDGWVTHNPHLDDGKALNGCFLKMNTPAHSKLVYSAFSATNSATAFSLRPVDCQKKRGKLPVARQHGSGIRVVCVYLLITARPVLCGEGCLTATLLGSAVWTKWVWVIGTEQIRKFLHTPETGLEQEAELYKSCRVEIFRKRRGGSASCWLSLHSSSWSNYRR